MKAEAAVAKLNLTDKVSLATGIGWEVGNCVGNTLPIESIGFPGLCLEGKAGLFTVVITFFLSVQWADT